MGCNCDKDNGRYVPRWNAFTDFTPTIPKVYWEVYSQEQRIHHFCRMLDKLICYADMLGIKIDSGVLDIEDLKAEFDEFKASGFLDYYEAQLNAWIHENMPGIIAEAMRMVWFGLTLDGYFVAYIPESWADIVFDTGADYELDTYGRLILRWDVDQTYNVDQTPEVVRPSLDDYIRQAVRNMMNTLYSTGG